MTTRHKRLAGLLGIFAFSGFSQAALVEINTVAGHVVYDDATSKYWVWDLHAFVNKTLAEQLQQISTEYAAANYFGQSTWHMATRDETAALFSYRARDISVFNSTYTAFHFEVNPPVPQVHWFGRWIGQDTVMGIEGVMDDTYAVSIGAWSESPQYMGNTLVDAEQRFANWGAWVTTSVPEPSSLPLVLLGLGSAVTAGARRRGVQAGATV